MSIRRYKQQCSDVQVNVRYEKGCAGIDLLSLTRKASPFKCKLYSNQIFGKFMKTPTLKELHHKRVALFFEKLRIHPPVTNRQEAVSLIKRLLTEIDDADGLVPGDFTTRLNILAISADYGWKNIESDPCYWDDNKTKTHRIYLYNSGRIVIERVKEGEERLILDKPGA